MTGRVIGLVTRVQHSAPLAKWTHCMIHRESLASKKLPESLEVGFKAGSANGQTPYQLVWHNLTLELFNSK